MGVCNCSMFCCTLFYVHSGIAIILRGKRELVALLNLSSWCLVMVERLFLAVPWGCLWFVIVVFPDHTHLLYCLVIFSAEKESIQRMNETVILIRAVVDVGSNFGDSVVACGCFNCSNRFDVYSWFIDMLIFSIVSLR